MPSLADIVRRKRSGLMGFTDPNWSRSASTPIPTRVSPTAPFGGGIGKGAYTGVKPKKKGLNWEEISEVMSEMQMMEPEFVRDQASQGGQDFKLSLMDEAHPDTGNLALAPSAFWKRKLGYA